MRSRSGIARWLAGLAALAMSTSVWAGELKVRTQLIWGTDGNKPAEKDFKELDPELRRKLQNTLRWKNYYVVNSRVEPLSKDTARFALSERCTVGLKPAGKSQFTVQIFNPMAPKPTEAVFAQEISVESLKKGEAVAIGANSRDRWDDAWLVIVTAAE